jgi:hypothetical protein
MQSESARMNSAAEARFRVAAANSLPRSIAVIALDAVGEDAVRRLAAGVWPHATFLIAPPHGDVLIDLTGRASQLAGEIAAADLVVLVAGPGGHAHAAAAIGEACSLRRVMTTGFIVGARSSSDPELPKTLAQLRPWSLMVVIATNDEYLDDMMTALRA